MTQNRRVHHPLQRGPDFFRSQRTRLPVLLQTSVDNLFEIRRDIGHQTAEGYWRLGKNRDQRRRKIAGLERGAAGQHLVENHAEGEDVGAPIDIQTPALFGRHVSRCS